MHQHLAPDDSNATPDTNFDVNLDDSSDRSKDGNPDGSKENLEGFMA